MKVRITRPTIAQKRQVLPGEELDVPQTEGIQLISAGKAIAVPEAEVETMDLPTDEIETREEATHPAVDDLPVEDPKQKPRKKKKVS